MGNLGNRFPFPSSVCMPWLLGTWIVGLALARSGAKNLSSPPCAFSSFSVVPNPSTLSSPFFLGGWKEGPPPPPPSKPVAVLGSLPFPPPPSPFLNRLPPPEFNQLTSSSFVRRRHRRPNPLPPISPSRFPSLPAKKTTRAGIR